MIFGVKFLVLCMHKYISVDCTPFMPSSSCYYYMYRMNITYCFCVISLVTLRCKLCVVCAAVASSCVSNEPPEEAATSGREDDVLLNVIRPDYERPAPPPPMKPLYPLTEDGKVQGKSCKLGLSLSGNKTRLEMNLSPACLHASVQKHQMKCILL